MTNPYETYYLTRHSDINTKTRKLLKQQGWRREILDALLQEKDDESTLNAIDHTLSSISPSKSADDDESGKRHRFLIELLPKNIQRKASMLLHYIVKVARITEEGIVQYEDGSYGSNLIDLLKYLCGSGFSVKKPFDADKLENLVKNAGAPESAFGKQVMRREQPQKKHQWINRS